MFSFGAENIYEVAKPIHIWSQLLGLTSFAIRKRKNVFEAYTTVFSLICLTISTIWSLTVATSFLVSFENMWNVDLMPKSEVYSQSLFMVVVAFVFISIVTNWWTFLARKHFATALSLLQEVDEEFKRLKVSVNLKRQKKFVLLFVLSIKVITVGLMGLAFYVIREKKSRTPKSFVFISLWITAQQCILVIFQFIFQVLAVKKRYQRINLLLKEISFVKDVNYTNHVINSLASMHDKLVDVSESINRSYGFPVSRNKNLKLEF